MNRTERLYRIDRLIRAHACVPVERFVEVLEISRATFKRDIEYMRSRLHAPIVWDREKGGYCFTVADPRAPTYELPGLWFNASEIHALLTMLHLLKNLEPGMLGQHVNPIRARLVKLLGSTAHAADEIEGRIRILHMTARKMKLEHFELVATALLRRKRLHMSYFSRGRGEETDRDVSPQRLVHYRDNWYLDAWCHRTDGLRTFALDCIRTAAILDEKASAVPEQQLTKCWRGVRHFFRPADGHGEDPFLACSRALGVVRGMAPRASGALRTGRVMGLGGALQRRSRAADGHTASRARGRGAGTPRAEAAPAGGPSRGVATKQIGGSSPEPLGYRTFLTLSAQCHKVVPRCGPTIREQ